MGLKGRRSTSKYLRYWKLYSIPKNILMVCLNSVESLTGFYILCTIDVFSCPIVFGRIASIEDTWYGKYFMTYYSHCQSPAHAGT